MGKAERNDHQKVMQPQLLTQWYSRLHPGKPEDEYQACDFSETGAVEVAGIKSCTSVQIK